MHIDVMLASELLAAVGIFVAIVAYVGDKMYVTRFGSGETQKLWPACSDFIKECLWSPVEICSTVSVTLRTVRSWWVE
jgi:hypothetical protein